jgi:hypothetical protein
MPANGLIRFYFPAYATYKPDTDSIYSIDTQNSNTYLIFNSVEYSDTTKGLYYIEV